MTRTLALFGMLFLALPAAAAQTHASATPRIVSAPGVNLPPLPTMPRVSAGHAAALGAGMFAGALAGSVLINGGALAALIGAAAGLTAGHWYWTEARDMHD